MIVFSPGFDPATNANLAVVRKLESTGHRLLLGHDATRTNLLAAIGGGGHLYAMSHGDRDSLLAHNREVALNGADRALLNGRATFAFACYTGVQLGQFVSESGGTWWGYVTAITAPDARPQFIDLFAEIFAYLQSEFSVATSAVRRQVVLHGLRSRCDRAKAVIENAACDDPSLDVLEPISCLLQIWDRLRIWVPPGTEPEHHPAAAPPILPL